MAAGFREPFTSAGHLLGRFFGSIGNTVKILFLDIDGVLNSLGSVLALGDPSHHLDPVSVGLIARVCRETDAQIVVSSSWRIGKAVKLLRHELQNLGAYKLAERVIGKTGDGHHGHRGRQIKQWREDNGHTGPYVITDDDSDMLPEQKPYFVHTNWEDGFRARHYREAIKILNPEHSDSKIILMADSL